jgi:trehalose 6-phosphate phosphatase
MNRTAFLLDVDGTLLDIAATPARVIVSARLRSNLGDLLARAGGALALVSGRTIDMLDRLFAPLKAPAIGGHGAEMRLSQSESPLKRPISISATLRQRLHSLSALDPRLLVEDKLHSVAVHYRLALQREDVLKTEVMRLVEAERDGDIEILPGKAVIEVKPREFNKGSAVIELMAHAPFAGRTPIFIGDDTTDEAVFAILPRLAGHGYSVGRLMQGADASFASPQQVRAWLQRLSKHAGYGT